MRFVGFAPGDFDGLRRGAGCSSCGGTGYRGRTGVYELLTPSQEVKKRVLAGTMGEGTEISGYEPMVVHGRSLAKRGVTSVEALCKVVRCKA